MKKIIQKLLFCAAVSVLVACLFLLPATAQSVGMPSDADLSEGGDNYQSNGDTGYFIVIQEQDSNGDYGLNYDDTYGYGYTGSYRISRAEIALFWISFILTGFVIPAVPLVLGIILPNLKKNRGKENRWYLLSVLSGLWILFAAVVSVLLVA